jgi:hypothetical protein
MPILRSIGPTANVFAICGSAVAITVPSSCSMKSAPATRSAMIELCRAENSMEKKLSAREGSSEPPAVNQRRMAGKSIDAIAGEWICSRFAAAERVQRP